jgi:hypothetical protein
MTISIICVSIASFPGYPVNGILPYTNTTVKRNHGGHLAINDLIKTHPPLKIDFSGLLNYLRDIYNTSKGRFPLIFAPFSYFLGHGYPLLSRAV